ncbi:MAG: TRAP transporter small permease, partial [Treponema sp.]|nr:TRAP transporter small permease [Treponema sp.]
MGIHTSRLRTVSWLENGICYASLSLLALIPFAELVLRQFNMAIPASKAAITHLFLVAGFFSAMITSKSGEHISITAVQYIKNENVKRVCRFASALLSVFVLSILVWNCISFIKHGLMGRMIGPVQDRIFAVAMPLGYAVMVIRLFFRFDPGRRVFALAAALLGTAVALPAIAKLIWGFEPPEPFFSWINSLYDAAWFIYLPAVLFLILAALTGMPVFAAIGGIAMVMLQAAGR